jgi:hypothetical protein
MRAAARVGARGCGIACLDAKVRKVLGMKEVDCCTNGCNHGWCACCLANMEYDAAVAHKRWLKGDNETTEMLRS